MVSPESERRIIETDGVDPLNGGKVKGDALFPNNPPSKGFDPQPTAGIGLWEIDPLPNEREHILPETEVE